jgi:isopenicillin-N N-acyltransferase like protein
MTPRIRVEGTHYERGRQYGAQARAQVHLSVQAYQRVFAHYAGWDWPAVRRAAAAFEAPIAAFRPAYLDEMRGIAEGAGLDLADVLAINVRTEVMYAAKASQAPLAARVPRLPAECSAFAVVPAPRAPGDRAATLLGQNWDWLLHSAQTLIVLEVRQDGGPDFVTVVEAGLLAKAGLNAAGLGLVTNALVTDADTGTPGLPYHVLLRAILDCATVTEALTVLQAGLRSSSANYLIAHASGAALDVEAAPGDFTRLYPHFPDHGLLLHTNHFLSPRLHPVDVSLWAMPSSAVRLQRLRAAGEAGTAKTLDDFRALLADHADYPHSICSHPDPHDHPLEQGATIASVLMDLNARRLWLAAGCPCQAPYREHDLSWLGAPGPPPEAAGPAQRACAAATAAPRR